MPRLPHLDLPDRSLDCRQDRHRSCTGCEGCACHHRPAPPDFRALVEAAREETR